MLQIVATSNNSCQQFIQNVNIFSVSFALTHFSHIFFPFILRTHNVRKWNFPMTSIFDEKTKWKGESKEKMRKKKRRIARMSLFVLKIYWHNWFLWMAYPFMFINVIELKKLWCTQTFECTSNSKNSTMMVLTMLTLRPSHCSLPHSDVLIC